MYYFPWINTHTLLNALPEKVPTQGHNIKQAPSSKKGTLILLHVLKYYAYTENLFLLPLWIINNFLSFSMQDFSSLDPSSSAHHCVVFLGKTLLSLSVLLQTRVKHLGTSKISENSDTILVRTNILTSSCKPLGLQPLTVSGISILLYPQDIKIDNPNSFFSIFTKKF